MIWWQTLLITFGGLLLLGAVTVDRVRVRLTRADN